jgi:hypothetical protein
MTKELDFEAQWQEKLGFAIANRTIDAAQELILEDGVNLSDQSPTSERLAWTCDMLERLGEYADLETRQRILSDCHCSYPLKDLLEIKLAYRVYGDLDQVLSMLQDKFDKFLRETLDLEEELIKKIIERGWGLAGRRVGNTIIATKIPKSGYLREYFKEENPARKRQLYCHCPRIRDEIGNGPDLPLTYCYCGAGFYKGIWEEILGEEVEVEMLESVIQGDDVCKVAIHLPLR